MWCKLLRDIGKSNLVIKVILNKHGHFTTLLFFKVTFHGLLAVCLKDLSHFFSLLQLF